MSTPSKSRRSTRMVAILLVSALVGALVLIVFVPTVIETHAVEHLQHEQDLATKQTATILSGRLAEVRRRLQWASLEEEPEDLLASLERPWDDEYGIFLFVHDEAGKIVAVDRRLDPEMADHFAQHVHDPEPSEGPVHVCKKCLDDMHAVGAAVERPDGTRLVASIDVEKLASGALEQSIEGTRGRAVLRAPQRELFATGVQPDHPLRSTVPIQDTPWSVAVATPETLSETIRRDIAVFAMLAALVFLILLLSIIAHYRATRRVVAERRRVEKELAGQAKLATLGLLSASLSHEINNALHVAMIYVDVAREATDPGERAEVLGEVEEALHTIEKVSRDTLGFAREQQDTGEFRVADVVDDALRVVGPRLKRIDVVVECDGDGPVEGNAGNITQVVVNLLLNAAQAMEDRGDTVRVSQVVAGDRVQLVVEDDGPGIAPEMLDELFTPLATTKESGTGLGLWLSRQIITQHGGTIRAENRTDGSGARFIIELPLREDETLRAA